MARGPARGARGYHLANQSNYVNKETDAIDRKMLRLLYKLSVFNIVSLKVHMLSMRQLSHYVTLVPPLRIETYSQMFHATGLQTE